MFPDTQPYRYQSPLHTEHPGTTTSADDDITMQGGRVHAQTQTTSLEEAIGVARPPFVYGVTQKASDYGLRVEHRYINSSPGIPLMSSKTQEMLWEYPGSRRHQRSSTYPAPSFEYSRPPTTPHYLPPPSTTQFSQRTTPAVQYTAPCSTSISRNTQRALDTIHSMVSRSTTYNDHYTPRTYTQLQPNRKIDYSISSRLSQRPWTDESRGKYNTDFPTGPLIDPLLSDDEDQSEEDGGSESREESASPPGCPAQEGVSLLPSPVKQAVPTEQGAPAHSPSETYHRMESGDATSCAAEEKTGAYQRVAMCDASTQTDAEETQSTQSPPPSPSYNLPPTNVTGQALYSDNVPSQSLPSRNPIDSLTAKLYKLPMLDQQWPATELRGNPATAKMQSARGNSAGDHTRMGGELTAAQKQDLERRKSLSQPSVSHKLQTLSNMRGDAEMGSQLRTPRTVESTRKMMEVFNRFNRSESMRRFHQQYKESVAPDLRQFSIREGKRHVIHGRHAYYYH